MEQLECEYCNQTIENCECHISAKEKHKGLIEYCKYLLEIYKNKQ